MRTTSALLVSLCLISAPAFAANPVSGVPTREQVQKRFSQKAVRMFDRVLKTGARGTSNPIVSEKDHYAALWNHAGARTDSATIHKGQLIEIAAVEGQRGGTRQQVVRNYRERPLLGKLMRIESTVDYRADFDKNSLTDKQLLKSQKRLVLGGVLKIPLPSDGKKILGQVQ